MLRDSNVSLPSALALAVICSVLACSSCYNKTPQTGELVNSRDLLLSVLEAGSLRSGCWHGWMRALFWAAGFSSVLPWKKGVISLHLFPDSTNSVQEGSTFTT